MTEIRRVQPQEESQVKQLVSSVMREEFPNAQGAFPTEDLDHLLDHYRSLGEAFFVAVNDKHLVGTLGIKRENERTALLRRFVVLSDYRKKGIGQLLLNRAIQFCKEAGYQEILVKTTSSMDRAIEVCKKAGFQERGQVDMGPVKLCRYVFFLKENSPLQATSS